jgi:hypothetical protein
MASVLRQARDSRRKMGCLPELGLTGFREAPPRKPDPLALPLPFLEHLEDVALVAPTKRSAKRFTNDTCGTMILVEKNRARRL